MKISINWLNDYVDLKNVSVSEIVDKLTYAGLEVEEVDDQSKKFENIIIGYVKEVKKHPNADKLSLCKVYDGKDDYSVVCGASNVAAGQKVAFAKVGAVIPNGGMKLEKVKIRGEFSFGMICSERELGLGDNHEGIMVLDPSLKEGVSFADALELNDTILEIAITPNRADALSHIGVARELSALFDLPLKYPDVNFKESGKKSKELASVEIKNSNNCPRYIGKVVSNVDVKESPNWLMKRLKSIGLRPINNVVDVTNYVLHEVGQPLHAFDLDNLGLRRIIVRDAGKDTKFITLDSKERKLQSNDLMICDANKPVAIAGVMGGENSEVTPATKNLLIESAYFNSSSIRRTSKNLGLSTDASYRFERGTDHEITKWAARRAAQLIQATTSSGIIAKGEIDAYPKRITKKKVSLRYSRIEKILGYKINNSTVKKILAKLGFEIKSTTKEKLTVMLPTYRHDIEREIDLIEEVARIYGYNKIPEVSKISVTLEEKVDHSAFNDNVREFLNSLGFYEIITNSLLSEDIVSRFGSAINLINPQSNEMSHLRTSLIPGLLTSISNNIKVNEKDLQLFEVGKIFEKVVTTKINDFKDFKESEHLLLALTGNRIRTEWFEKDSPFDVYDLTGFVESFMAKILAGNTINLKSKEESESKFDYAFNINCENQIIGSGGKLKKEYCTLFDIDQDVYMIQIDLSVLKKINVSKKIFNELLKFPKVYRDVAFVLDVDVTSDQVIHIIKEATTNLLHNIKLFDIFQSESLGKGKKSLAFQLEFFNSNRTLTEEEVEKDFRNAIKAVEKIFNAQLRGS
ncbi:MAG: phenylalanine--tRNA ligase subunit beta [Melioribacter sp.]|nr:phenylalanine--tRNA ligase subunit beta [Melioribacter sp.]